jgi:integrase
VRGYRPKGDNPARWSGHIEEALPARTTLTRKYAALPYAEVPDFIAKLSLQRGVGPKAMEFMILTAGRSIEVKDARWSEIDLEKRLWIIPAPRMKEKREHRLPLPDRAIAILKELPREGEFVFIGGWKNHPIGKNTFLKLIRGLGHEHVTAHGFRSSFRDWAGETTSFPADVCEVALSHLVGGKVLACVWRIKRLRLPEIEHPLGSSSQSVAQAVSAIRATFCSKNASARLVLARCSPFATSV